ncbi:hypothetical protein D7D52_30580 [Nocardia yunnanensis]|uniref:DUF4352 domain-containing protein n=1 Tax=Nocardia yunnanensis TaxID=2382165 RepID=A0A386ZJJ5_9NOCA|nr:hypothetical protein [Nocardia yunnanensis]AYF77443.1 hypothetical protein D7D52_30580 [Nocardia yunnanensis]
MHITSIRSKLTTVGAAALIATSALLMTACNDKNTPSPAATSLSAAAQPGAAQPGGTDKTGGTNSQASVRAIGKTGWYEGFEITVDKATVTPDESGGAKVRVDLTYKNTTTKDKTLDASPTLLINGAVDQGADSNTPTVPGKASATGDISTSVKKLDSAEHLLDTISVVFGTAADNQTTIPLKADAKADSVQPKTLNVSGTLVQDQTTVMVTGGTLTPSYTKGERNKMEVGLHIKLVGGSGIGDGGLNVFTEYFSLKGPDGQTVVADSRGFIDELLERNQTIDKADLYAVFVVPAPATGNYVLSYDATKGASPAPTFAFTVS